MQPIMYLKLSTKSIRALTPCLLAGLALLITFTTDISQRRLERVNGVIALVDFGVSLPTDSVGESNLS